MTDEIPLVRIALAVGDDELAEVASVQAHRRAQGNSHVTTIVATAAHVRGLLASDLDELSRAVQLFATGPRPMMHAYALEDLGVARARAGAVDAAIESFPAARWRCLRTQAPRGTRAASGAGSATTACGDGSSPASGPRPAGRR